MAPPFAPGGRPRGPPPFVVQMLRAPLSLNNIIAFFITVSAYRSRLASAALTETKTCMMRANSVFGVLVVVFAISMAHNIGCVMRFHKIRREVFGGDRMCGMKRGWGRRRGQCGESAPMDEEEMKNRMEKFEELVRRMPSLFISTVDVMLSVGFLGLYILTTLIAKKEGKVELGVAYASIGALVAL